jgi:hypothetical protein
MDIRPALYHGAAHFVDEVQDRNVDRSLQLRKEVMNAVAGNRNKSAPLAASI